MWLLAKAIQSESVLRVDGVQDWQVGPPSPVRFSALPLRISQMANALAHLLSILGADLSNLFSYAARNRAALAANLISLFVIILLYRC